MPDATTKPYSSIYADHQVVALIEDLQKNKKPLPADDLLVGRGRNATKVVSEYYRLNKGAKAAGAHAAGAPSALRPRGDAGAALRRELVLRRSASLLLFISLVPLCTPAPL